MSDKTIRQACRDRESLDGTDAQALEGALAQAEKKLTTLRKTLEEIAKKRCITEALQGLNDPLPPIDECKCSACIAAAALKEKT